MFAGVGCQGAEDAWYLAAMEIEHMTVGGDSYCGGTADIMKFFKQIPREVVYRIAERTGMPSRVLDTYRRFQEELKVRNSLVGTLGEEYKNRNSIPQGCPMSMMFVALIMRPWMSIMKQGGKVTPKLLADDIFLQASGQGMGQAFGGGYVMGSFGIANQPDTLGGKSISVNIHDFPPHYYINVPDNFNMSIADRLVNTIKQRLPKRFQKSIQPRNPSYNVGALAERANRKNLRIPPIQRQM